MTKLDKDQLDKITGGAGVTGQPQNQDLAGGTVDTGENTLGQPNEDLEDNGTGGGGQPTFGRNK